MKVVIIGGGFAGLAAAKRLGGRGGVEVLVIDRRNHHLFQPLLYQVAMAGLSPADIAAPIRSLLSRHRNISVIQGEVSGIDPVRKRVRGDFGEVGFDRLLIATGAVHAYFGHQEWETYAPGLKTVEQATEIRRRVLLAFERAEREPDELERKSLLTFVVVGGGPTGVELAGALGEMSRKTLARDFRNIDPTSTRVVLLEGGARILPGFSESSSQRAARDLEQLGVQVWTHSRVTHIDDEGVQIEEERIRAATVLWAAGVEPSPLGRCLGVSLQGGRVPVEADLSVRGLPHVFVAGDLAHFEVEGRALPGVAGVAMQQGRFFADLVLDESAGRSRREFHYRDKGQMATIGRSRAVAEVGKWRIFGGIAWIAWLVVHIYYLTGFRNRLLVLFQWAWSYFRFSRGARLIVDKQWRLHPEPNAAPEHDEPAETRRVG